MTRRLLWSTPWKPRQALLTGTVSEPATLDLVGQHNLAGVAGVTIDGRPWRLDARDRLVIEEGDLP